MDALDGGTLADAESALRARYGIDQDRARQDAIAATRDLIDRRVVMAADASGSFPAEPGTTELAMMRSADRLLAIALHLPSRPRPLVAGA